MFQKQMLLVAPVLALLGFGGHSVFHPTVARDRRIADARFYSLEAKTGHHLYAPTWLPQGGGVGSTGTIQGQFRILQEYDGPSGQSIVYLAQEPRSPERDRYHQRVFAGKADAKASIHGVPAYFVTGSTGERRLFWNTPEMAVILSAPTLGDAELLKIAQRVE